MKIVNQTVSMFDTQDYDSMLRVLEKIGRNCYQSESRGEPEAFVKMLIDKGHEGILEHVNFHFEIVTDRATANQIVRHRTGKYAQESTRYCNYSKDKFGNELTFVNNCVVIIDVLKYLESKYLDAVKNGMKPEDARHMLPQCTKTTLIATFDLRNLRHFLKLRLSKHAQKPIRDIATSIFKMLEENYPIFVRGIECDEE